MRRSDHLECGGSDAALAANAANVLQVQRNRSAKAVSPLRFATALQMIPALTHIENHSMSS